MADDRREVPIVSWTTYVREDHLLQFIRLPRCCTRRTLTMSAIHVRHRWTFHWECSQRIKE